MPAQDPVHDRIGIRRDRCAADDLVPRIVEGEYLIAVEGRHNPIVKRFKQHPPAHEWPPSKREFLDRTGRRPDETWGCETLVHESSSANDDNATPQAADEDGRQALPAALPACHPCGQSLRQPSRRTPTRIALRA